jgi:Fic family protein
VTRKSSETTGAPKERLSPAEIDALEAKNGLLQFDRMIEIIREHEKNQTPLMLTPALMLELQALAVQGLERAPGSLRQGAIYITGTNHVPPPAAECPGLVDELCAYVNDNWQAASPVHLASYVMWRLNWIHPFSDGNGRASRIVSYLVLSCRLGYVLPGVKTVPEKIAAHKDPYYAALDAADAAWSDGRLDVTAMEELMSRLLAQQLVEIHSRATGDHQGKVD